MSDDLSVLQAEYPAHKIWQEHIRGRARYVARSLRTGLNPHTVITDDLAELRAALGQARQAQLIPFSTTTPNIARIYDYLLAGKDNYPADRAAARKILRSFPEALQVARASRAFLTRAVRHVASQGVTQFIDLGAGLPTSPNTHETARAVNPDTRVAYVDRDELVLAYAHALLAVDDRIAVVAGDIANPAAVLADRVLTSVIDLRKPVCILLVSVLHFLPPELADAALAALRERMAPRSYLIISAGTSTGTDPSLIRCFQAAYDRTAPIAGRTAEEIAAWFEGLALARPGLVDVHAWRPADPPARAGSARARFLAGVACKPAALPSWQP